VVATESAASSERMFREPKRMMKAEGLRLGDFTGQRVSGKVGRFQRRVSWR